MRDLPPYLGTRRYQLVLWWAAYLKRPWRVWPRFVLISPTLALSKIYRWSLTVGPFEIRRWSDDR